MITHTIESYWIPSQKKTKSKLQILKNSSKFQIFEYRKGHYTRHTFWSWLIRCANMKWIRWVLLKIQSGHDSVHRWTDGRMDRRTRWYQYTPLSTSLKRGGYNYYGMVPHEHHCISNHLQCHCLINSLFRLISKKTSKLQFTGPLWGESIGNQWIPHTKGQ